MDMEKIEFLLSAMDLEQLPPTDQPEVAFSGRSNVGKSSLLNFLAGRKGIAKVSQKPGKTRAINLFEIDSCWRLVDLPGYGFAQVSKSEISRWHSLIDGYLRERVNLVGIFQLLDARHPPTKQDLAMLGWLAQVEMPTVLVLTKMDKLKKNEQRQLVRVFNKTYGFPTNWPVIATSTIEQRGREDLLAALDNLINSSGEIEST